MSVSHVIPDSPCYGENMVNHDNFIARGWRFYPRTKHQRPLYLKRVRDVEGKTLYDILVEDSYEDNAAFLDLSADFVEDSRYTADVRLYNREEWDGRHCTAVTFSIRRPATIEQVEAKVARMYEALGCIPDPHNQDS